MISRFETSGGSGSDSNSLPIISGGSKSVGPLDGSRDDGVDLIFKLISNLNFTLVVDVAESGRVDAELNLTPTLLTIMDKTASSLASPKGKSSGSKV